MRRIFRLFSTITMITLFILSLYNFTGEVLAQNQMQTKDYIKKIIQEYIAIKAGKNTKIIGCGSWISGGKYKDPLTYYGKEPSDHDMRIFVSKGTSDADALKEWEQAKDWIKNRIRQEYGKNADEIVKSVNIYPPDQLLKDVDSLDDAKKVFNKGRTPNLGNGEIEGLWKRDSKAFKQSYETTKGRVFYLDPKTNGVIVSSADLELLEEGRATFTIKGSANLSDEWMEHLSQSLKTKDARTTTKYLERIEESIKKGKSLARTSHGDYLSDVIAKTKALGDNAELTDDLIAEIKSSVRKAKLDSELLKQLSSATDANDIKLITQLLSAGDENVSKLRTSMIKDLANNIPADRLLQGVFILFDAYSAYDAKESGDNDKALRKILEAATSNLGAGPLTWVIVTNLIIEDAKETGYLMVSGRQDCEDLLAGICNVAGRRDATGFQKAEKSLDSIINRAIPPYNEEQFQSLIKVSLQTQARACTSRDTGPETQKTDLKIEEVLYDRCLKDLTTKFNEERVNKIAKIGLLESELIGALTSGDLPLYYQINTLSKDTSNFKAEAKVSAENTYMESNAKEIYKMMSELYKQVAGPFSYIKVSTTYKWFKDSKAETTETKTGVVTTLGNFFDNSKATAIFALDQPKDYNISFKYIVKIEYVLGSESVKDNVLYNAIKEFNLEQNIIRDSSTKIVFENKNNEEIVKGDVKIEGPDSVNKGEMITLKAILGESLKNQTDLKISWYADEKNGTPLEIGPVASRLADNYETEGKVYTAIVVVTQDTPNGVVEVAEARKSVSITVESLKDQINAALKQKDWKKLKELSHKQIKKEEIILLMNSIKELGTELQSENPRLIEQFKTYMESNKLNYLNYKTRAEAQAKIEADKADRIAKETNEDPDCTVMDMIYDCIDGVNGDLYTEEDSKINNAIGVLEQIYGDYELLIRECDYALNNIFTNEVIFSDGNFDFFVNNEDKQSKIAFDLTKTIVPLKYEIYCKGQKASEDLADISVKLRASKEKAKPGDIVKIETLVSSKSGSQICSGKPLKYEWAGSNISTTGSFATSSNVNLVASKNGNYNVGVTVRCDEKLLGKDSIAINVGGGVTGIITGIESEVLLGSTRTLSVSLKSDDKDDSSYKSVSGAFEIFWNSQPEIDFKPVNSKNGETTVTFNRMQSPIQIWAEIKRPNNGSYEYIGRTENIETKVVGPKFSIKFTPDKETIKVGQAVKAEIISDPKLDDEMVDYRWVEPSDITNLGSGKIEFTPKESKNIKLKAIARIPTYGDIINDNILQELMPGSYTVTANLMDSSKVYTVDEDVIVTAGVQGIDENQVSFEWTINKDGRIIKGQNSKSATVQNTLAGSGVASVTAYDSKKNKLGEASVTFEVKGLTAIEKAVKLSEKQIQDGNLNEAVKILEEAVKEDPKNNELVRELEKVIGQKAEFDASLNKINQLMAEGKFDEAKKELEKAKLLNPKSAEITNLESSMHYKKISWNDDVYKKIRDASGALSSRYYKESLEKIAELRKNQNLDQKQLAELEKMEQEAKISLAKYEKASTTLLKGLEFFQAYDFVAAIPAFDEGLQDYINLMPTTEITEGRTKYGEYQNMKAESQRRISLIAEQLRVYIIPASNNSSARKEEIETGLKCINNILELQPPNADALKYKVILENKLSEINAAKENNSFVSSSTGQSWGKATPTIIPSTSSGQSWGAASVKPEQAIAKPQTLSEQSSDNVTPAASQSVTIAVPTIASSSPAQSWGAAITKPTQVQAKPQTSSGQSWGTASTKPMQLQPYPQISSVPVLKEPVLTTSSKSLQVHPNTQISSTQSQYKPVIAAPYKPNVQSFATVQNYSGVYSGSIAGDGLTGSLSLKVSGNQAEIYTTGKMKVYSESYNYSFVVSGRGTVDNSGKVTLNTVSGQLNGLGEVVNVVGSMIGRISENQVAGTWTGKGSWTETGTWQAVK